MSVSIDLISSGANTDGTVPLTVSHTVTAPANLLVVGVAVDCTTNMAPVEVTWNGVSMTAVTSGEVLGSATTQHVATFYMINPATGTHDVVINITEVNSTNFICGMIGSFLGVTVSNPITGVQSSSGSGTSRTVTVTSRPGDLVVDFVGINSNPTITPTQTQRVNANTGGSGGTMYGMSSAAGAASVDMSWSWAGAGRSSQVGFSINGDVSSRGTFIRQAVHRASRWRAWPLHHSPPRKLSDREVKPYTEQDMMAVLNPRRRTHGAPV